jgi:hypothetical protein
MEFPRIVTDRAAFDREMALNKEAYEGGLRERLQRDHVGEYALIAFGRLITTTPDYEAALRALEQLDPQPQHVLLFPAEEEAPFAFVEG